MEYRKLTAALWTAASVAAMSAAYAQTPPPPAAATPAQTPSPPAAAAPAPTPAAEEPAPTGLMIGPIKLSAQFQAGFNINPMRPADGLNFGQLFTDHANQATINQVLLTASKALDPKDPDYQWGMKIQFMYGSDARYTQFLGELNRVIPDQRYQFDVVEANFQLHVPWLTEGGIDFKVGQYTTPIGYETIDPSTNPFYSHSYIFQFGLPFKHTGALAVTHVNSTLDIYSGIDTGTNTTFGPLGENNGAVGALFGFGLNLMDGNLTILALSHLAPEQATRVLSPIGFNANGTWRSFNDVVITYKGIENVTLVTEFNWVRDSYGVVNRPVNGFGVAQYASYALTDTIALNARGEIWRDDNNFFVAAFPTNNGFIRFQQGLSPTPVIAAPCCNTTYGALTLGVTWKPEMPSPVGALMIRPEIRWDHAFTGNKPFNAQRDNNAFTFGADVVISF